MTRKFKKASVIGGGVIGSSFTLLFALGGMEVMNYNRSVEGEEKSKKTIRNYLKELVAKEIIPADEEEKVLSKSS